MFKLKLKKRPGKRLPKYLGIKFHTSSNKTIYEVYRYDHQKRWYKLREIDRGGDIEGGYSPRSIRSYIEQGNWIKTE